MSGDILKLESASFSHDGSLAPDGVTPNVRNRSSRVCCAPARTSLARQRGQRPSCATPSGITQIKSRKMKEILDDVLSEGAALPTGCVRWGCDDVRRPCFARRASQDKRRWSARGDCESWHADLIVSDYDSDSVF